MLSLEPCLCPFQLDDPQDLEKMYYRGGSPKEQTMWDQFLELEKVVGTPKYGKQQAVPITVPKSETDKADRKFPPLTFQPISAPSKGKSGLAAHFLSGNAGRVVKGSKSKGAGITFRVLIAEFGLESEKVIIKLDASDKVTVAMFIEDVMDRFASRLAGNSEAEYHIYDEDEDEVPLDKKAIISQCGCGSYVTMALKDKKKLKKIMAANSGGKIKSGRLSRMRTESTSQKMKAMNKLVKKKGNFCILKVILEIQSGRGTRMFKMKSDEKVLDIFAKCSRGKLQISGKFYDFFYPSKYAEEATPIPVETRIGNLQFDEIVLREKEDFKKGGEPRDLSRFGFTKNAVAKYKEYKIKKTNRKGNVQVRFLGMDIKNIYNKKPGSMFGNAVVKKRLITDVAFVMPLKDNPAKFFIQYDESASAKAKKVEYEADNADVAEEIQARLTFIMSLHKARKK